MSYPAGTRDGAFIKIEGWDLPGHDVGQYLTELTEAARTTALKDTCLQYGARFFAFNTYGWCKSWTKIHPSKFVRMLGCTLYIRVEYPGWVFYPRKSTDILRVC